MTNTEFTGKAITADPARVAKVRAELTARDYVAAAGYAFGCLQARIEMAARAVERGDKADLVEHLSAGLAVIEAYDTTRSAA